MSFRKIRKLFKRGNVCVTGLRGTGKDMLFANVVVRDKRPYISNVDYCCKSVYIPLDFKKLDVKNNYKNLVSSNVVPYEYPYPEDCDIYLSDAGVYFPSQYCNELNKEYSNMPVFQALSRQLGECNFHVNVQNLNRCWDKIREQSDIYIRCESCRVFHGIVFQVVYVYDNYQSCVDRVLPYVHIRAPLMAKPEVRAQFSARDEEQKRLFIQNYGEVKKHILIYRNKSRYDTRLFKSILKGG